MILLSKKKLQTYKTIEKSSKFFLFRTGVDQNKNIHIYKIYINAG